LFFFFFCMCFSSPCCLLLIFFGPPVSSFLFYLFGAPGSAGLLGPCHSGVFVLRWWLLEGISCFVGFSFFFHWGFFGFILSYSMGAFWLAFFVVGESSLVVISSTCFCPLLGGPIGLDRGPPFWHSLWPFCFLFPACVYIVGAPFALLLPFFFIFLWRTCLLGGAPRYSSSSSPLLFLSVFGR